MWCGMMVGVDILHGKNTGRDMVCWWYGKTLMVWYMGKRWDVVWYIGGMVSWVYCMVEFAWWYSMFQYIRSVKVEYVERISYVTTIYISTIGKCPNI